MNIAKMMKQAKEMQTKMQDLQEKLGDIEVSGEAGAGMVQVTVTGKGELKALKIDPKAVDTDDLEMLEDLIVAAFNDGKARADEKMQEESERLMAEMGLPAGMLGGGGLPF